MNIADNSWIKLPRNFVNWRWYHDSNMVQLYLYLLLNANVYDVEYNDFTVKRGECLISLRQLSHETGISERSLRTCLNKLKRTKEIEYKKLHCGRIIILVDFNKFQPIGIDEAAPDWIKLYRKICDWRWYHESNMVHLYVYFMLKANLVVEGSRQNPAWQLCSTLRLLTNATGISVHSIRTCLDRLQRTGEIIYLPGVAQRKSTITLCNYDTYQSSKIPSDTDATQMRHRCDTDATQMCHRCATDVPLLKEYKNKRIKERKNFDDDARACESVFVEVTEKNEEKENEQKKARKESFAEEVLSDELWINAVLRKFKLSSIEDVKQKVEDFEIDITCRGKSEHVDLKDYKCHFCDWLCKNNSVSSKSNSQYGVSKQEKQIESRFVPKSSEGEIYTEPF